MKSQYRLVAAFHARIYGINMRGGGKVGGGREGGLCMAIN